MKREIIQGLGSSGENISVELAEATVLMGMKRTRLRLAAGEVDETDIDLRILRLMTYPDLLAAVVEQTGFSEWPISFEAFCKLPDKFVSEWEQGVYTLNPHWLPDYDQSTEEKKDPPAS